jgi:hypothetical protein
MQLISEECEEQDRNSISLLGYKDNTSDSMLRAKHANNN